MPPILAYALFLWASAAICLRLWIVIDPLVVVALGLLALCSIPMFFKSRPRARMAGWCLAGALLGLALSCIYVNLYGQSVRSLEDGKTHWWDVELVSDARESSGRMIVSGKVISVDGAALLGLPCYRTVTVFISQNSGVGNRTLLYGDRLTIEGVFKESTDEYRLQNRESGILGSISARKAELGNSSALFDCVYALRRDVIETIDERTDSEATKSVVEAIVCGYKVPLANQRIYEAYKACGIAHMVAVSGAHLSIVCGLLNGILTVFGIRKRPALLMQVVFIVLYMVFTGMQISTLRAALMMACALSAFLFGRRPASLNALGLCIVLLCILNPSTCLSLSFFLSAGSTLGIIVFSRLIEHWLTSWFACKSTWSVTLCSLASLTLSANMVTLPVCAAIFSQISCVALLANIIITPIFTFLCCIGALSCAVLTALPWLFSLGMGAVFFLADTLNVICLWIAGLPGASIPADVAVEGALVGTILGVCILYLVWPEVKLMPFCACVCVGLTIAFMCTISVPSNRIVMLDVGQGDAILIMSEGKTALIDTGCDDAKLKKALARYGVKKVDLLFLSHPDNDHVGSYEALDSVTVIDNVCVAKGLATCACEKCTSLRKTIEASSEASLRYVSAGDSLYMGIVTFCVLGPQSFSDQGGNADSLCLQVSADWNKDGKTDSVSLFCGDAESETLEKLFVNRSKVTLDVMKISHHGSKAALSENLSEKMRVSIALVSVGENTYGHPNANTLSLAKNMGARVFRTDVQGDVIIDIGKAELEVTTLK